MSTINKVRAYARNKSSPHRNKRYESGFTLVEILVATIIIGILAAIAIPIMYNQTQAAYDTQVRSDVRNAATNATALMQKHRYASYVNITDNDIATAPVIATAYTEGDMNTPARDINQDGLLRVWVGDEADGSDATYVDVTVTDGDTQIAAISPETRNVIVYAWHPKGQKYNSMDSPLVFDSRDGGFIG